MAKTEKEVRIRVEFKTGKDELSKKLTSAYLDILRRRAKKDTAAQ